LCQQHIQIAVMIDIGIAALARTVFCRKAWPLSNPISAKLTAPPHYETAAGACFNVAS